MLNSSTVSNIFLVCCLVANVVTFPSVMAEVNQYKDTSNALGNEEREFIFAGHCPNGEAYRIFAYQMDVDGLAQSFYDYEGPAGKGTVRTGVSPKKMALRVCHELADITDGSKYD